MTCLCVEQKERKWIGEEVGWRGSGPVGFGETNN